MPLNIRDIIKNSVFPTNFTRTKLIYARYVCVKFIFGYWLDTELCVANEVVRRRRNLHYEEGIFATGVGEFAVSVKGR